MDQREKDIKILCEKIKEMSPIFWDNPNGPYEYSCPFCHNHTSERGAIMSDIKHDHDCPYLIAKDLSSVQK
jgi:hypothetical protein